MPSIGLSSQLHPPSPIAKKTSDIERVAVDEPIEPDAPVPIVHRDEDWFVALAIYERLEVVSGWISCLYLLVTRRSSEVEDGEDGASGAEDCFSSLLISAGDVADIGATG